MGFGLAKRQREIRERRGDPDALLVQRDVAGHLAPVQRVRELGG